MHKHRYTVLTTIFQWQVNLV